MDNIIDMERISKLNAYITCLKCNTKGHPCNYNCPTQYEAGNMKGIIENLEAISKFLEQVSITNKDAEKSVINMWGIVLSIWLPSALAIGIAVYTTHDMRCLWFLLIPALMNINYKND